MKRTLRNGLSFLLVAVLLLSMLSATAVGLSSLNPDRSNDETDLVPVVAPESSEEDVLYRWTAFESSEVFSSNLSGETERWNESAEMYTQREVKQVKLHNFLNPGENLQVDLNLEPQVSTAGKAAVALSFVYAHRGNENDLNPANSGLLQVYASEDGENWSEDFVGVRSADILGIGTTNDGENIIYYQITTENLAGLASGGKIAMLRIMPDGESGLCGGTFALCELTVTGYETVTGFWNAVPAGIRGEGAPGEDVARESIVKAAIESDAGTSLGRIQDALALFQATVPESESAFLSTAVLNTEENTAGIRLVDGIDTKAKDTVLELLDQLLERETNLTSDGAEAILEGYETITTTSDIVKRLNTPQQIFRAYANAKPGDLLLRDTGAGAEVYMITEITPVWYPDGVNVDFTASEMTYLTATGEYTLTFQEMFVDLDFVPLTVSALLPWNLDAYASAVGGVKVAVISNRVVDQCVITVDGTGTTVIVDDLGMAAPICSDSELDAAVAELGEGPHTMTVTVTNDLGATETIKVDFEVAGQTPRFELYGTNITMGNTLDMNFYVAQSNFNGSGYYAVLDGPDNSSKMVPMTEWVENNGYYQFTYDGLAAKQMSDEIAVTVYDAQGNQVSEVWTDSMRSYVMRVLDKQTEDTARTLLVDMLNYGAAAQTSFTYNTEDLANNQLTEEQQAYATQEVKICTDGRVKGANYYGTNFDLVNQISMNLYFVNVTNDMSAKIEFTDHYGKQHTVTVPGSEFSDNDDCKVINVDEIVAADGRQNVTCTVYDVDGATVVASVTDSLESYVARMCAEYPWLEEIMKFSDSAYAYLHRKDT